MKIIPLDLTGADVSHGHLFDKDDPEVLTDDMLLVKVRGYSIDVSWAPEFELSGRYTITVYREQWDRKVWEYSSDDPYDVARLVEQQIRRLSESVVAVSASKIQTEQFTEQAWSDTWAEARGVATDLLVA